MPLIVITGVPCSGKTMRAKQLKHYFETQDKEVYIVSEEEELKKANFTKNSCFLDSGKEKHIRSILKSEVLRNIGPKIVVILDASNYIKGYRYELFCASKANKCTQCTIHTEINQDEAWSFNENRNKEEKYTKEVFDAMLIRYEAPDSKNRWDSPLFLVFPKNDLLFKEIYDCLFNKKLPTPNQSTQNAPLSATNFLYELDKVTKDITDRVLKLKTHGARGEVAIPGYPSFTINMTNVTAPQMMILRRQYITYSKMHTPDINKIPQLYINYLKASLK